MKKYKGWEIAKLISEGKLEGKKLMLLIEGEEYNHHYRVNRNILMDGTREVGSSILTDTKMEYTLCQEPISFMDCVSSNGNVRVDHELTNELFKHIHIPMNLSNVLFQITNHLESNEDLKKVILEGKWYLEEADNED